MMTQIKPEVAPINFLEWRKENTYFVEESLKTKYSNLCRVQRKKHDCDVHNIFGVLNSPARVCIFKNLVFKKYISSLKIM